jgi:hypothetical protein
MAGGLPWMKFFPRDWMVDERLRGVSLAARGLWMDVLCLMWQSPERGRLIDAAGGPLPLPRLARTVGEIPDIVASLLDELRAAGVYDLDAAGVICSRRMIRDEAFRVACSAAGKKGGGNPTLKGGPKGDAKGSPKVTPKPQRFRDQKTEENTENPPHPPAGGASTKPRGEDVPIPAALDTPEFRAVWAEWLTHRRERQPAVTQRAARMQLNSLAGLAAADAVACVRSSIANDYQGLFPEKFGRQRAGPNLLDRAAAVEGRIMGNIMEGLNSE